MSHRDGPGTGSDEPEVKPFPKPVRYTLLILLGAFIGVGLVTLLYSRGVLPIAGPFVAMILGPVCVFLGLLWRRRRLIRRSRAVAGDVDRLRSQLEAERRQPAAVRPTAATDESLERVADVVRRAMQQLAWGQEPEAVQGLTQAADHVSREWRGDAALTAEVRRIAERARPLAKPIQGNAQPGR